MRDSREDCLMDLIEGGSHNVDTVVVDSEMQGVEGYLVHDYPLPLGPKTVDERSVYAA
jgi:hypothetical protein